MVVSHFTLAPPPAKEASVCLEGAGGLGLPQSPEPPSGLQQVGGLRGVAEETGVSSGTDSARREGGR